MEKDLECRVRDFRGRIMGKDLSKRYPFKLSADGTTIEKAMFSGFDSIKFLSRFIGKVMVPYKGDILMKDWVKLESEIHPARKNEFYLCVAGFTVAKYAALGSLIYGIGKNFF